MSRFSVLLLTVIFLVTFSTCGKDKSELDIPPEEEDLVAETGGKSDTGYMSNLATELEGEFEGVVMLDVSRDTPEEKQKLLEDLRNKSWQLKDTVISHVKFSKNKLNMESLHMNLYSDVIEAESIELVDDKWIEVKYKARLESIVSHEELEKAGKSIENILANPTTTVKLPADPRNLFDRVGESCAEGFEQGELHNYNYFYYFSPDKEECDIELVEAQFTVSSLAPPAETTYPEYDRLAADHKVTAIVIFGAAGHEEEVSNYDWGMMEWRDFKRYMVARGFSKVEDLNPGERFRRVRNGIEEIIDIISPTDIYHNPESDSIFKKGISEHEIILYNGHSFYGSLNVLRDCSVYPQDTYQIFYMGSCWSYEYYTRQIFECKKSEDDPYGWDLADVVNDTEAGWFHNNAEFSRILLTNLFAGVETGGKDGSRYYTWFNIISAMNRHAINTWRLYGTKTHEIMGVSGVKNNKYDPEASGASGGKRYENSVEEEIPDNTPEGIRSEIVVPDYIVPGRITVSVNITHPYIGDLVVSLIRGDVEIILHDRQGGWEDDIIREFDITDDRLIGKDASGSWFLKITDNAEQDTGKLNYWSITLVP